MQAWRRPTSRRGLAVAVAALVVTSSLALGPDARPASAYPSDQVELSGRGWGHGRGMGQYGALGYAVNHGWSHSRILDHFYGGTTAGHQPDGVISVHLTRHDNRDLIVRSDYKFQVAAVDVPAGTAARVRRGADGRWHVDRGPGCGGPWTTAQIGLAASARPEATTTYGGDDLGSMLNLCVAGGTIPYRGAFMIRHDGDRTRVGNIITMERYLRGVVPRESPASWADLGNGRGIEALRAQAVAARSYAWGESRSPFKTCDTISCQVYGGARGEDPRTTWAIGGTTGEVRRHGDGRIARTEFSSSTGGYTAGGLFPAVPDVGDGIGLNPNHTWTASVPAADVGPAFGVGELLSLSVTRRNGLGADGGRVLEAEVRGTEGAVTVSGLQFRSALGLKSDWFTIDSPYPMDDVGDSVHRLAIEALVREGIVVGCTSRTFCPENDVSREQVATLLDRALDLPATSVDAFDDDAGSVHEGAINRAAAHGILRGTGGRVFRPGAPVARDQMASILARGFRLDASDDNPFTDVPASSVHLPGIRAVAAAGVANGCTPTRYCPGRSLTRAQAASLLARALGLV